MNVLVYQGIGHECVGLCGMTKYTVSVESPCIAGYSGCDLFFSFR